MEKVSDREYETRLRVIDGNPSVVTGATDGNRKRLTLIWGKLVSKNQKPTKVSQAVNPGGEGSSSDSVPAPSSKFDSILRLFSWANGSEGAIAFVVTLVTLGSFFGSWYMKSGLKEELREYIDNSVEKSLAPIRGDVGRMAGDITKLQAGLANLQGRLGGLSDIVYKEKASALGIREPQIVPVQLSELSVAPLVIRVTNTFSDGTIFQLEFKVEAVTQDSIKFLVSGIREGRTFLNTGITLPRQVGVPVELNKAVLIPGMPKILLTILDFPTKDTAIVAVGEKSNS